MTGKQPDTGHQGAKQGKPNRLIDEKSPYLLQHAHNPVDWYPWGEEALAKAKAEDKMMLVSIGYATCHWCHVMERESFEDPNLAAFLNAHFVAIKVDREERPDVDRVYMDALHAMGQQGGWPLNIFTTPEGYPVTGGTYFPPQDMQGRNSFMTVLRIVSEAWQKEREAILENSRLLLEHLQKAREAIPADAPLPTHKALDATTVVYRSTFDKQYGGFILQRDNKFPPSMGLLMLLRQHVRTGNEHALEMVEQTLQGMLAGGIYDQLGGGLSRYSTDYHWLVPHFEKMLYDNALFAQALTAAFQVTGKAIYRAYAEDVLGYVLRDMTHPEGAFFSAEDADSEGEEGRFYVWTPEEVRSILPAGQAEAALAYWNISEGGNFEGGRSIPHTPRRLDTVAESLGISQEDLASRLAEAREGLLAARAGRVRPLRDDKVLTSWNALMISALAQAGMAFGEPVYLEAATAAVEFLLRHNRDGQGRLLRRWRDGEGRHAAYLTDHASLAVACLDLYKATHVASWYQTALELVGEINSRFRNPEGPYFETASDAEALITRSVDVFDGVEPSGNSQAAMAMLLLDAHGAGTGLREDALRILRAHKDHMEQGGVSFGAMLCALDLHLAPPQQIAIVGEPGDPARQALIDAVHRSYTPNAVLAVATPAEAEALRDIIPLLAGRTAPGGRATAYVCREMTCKLPVHTPEDLLAQLREG